MTDRRAPHVFWTRSGGRRYAQTRNPHLPGTRESAEWLRDYWQDQADRGIERAIRLQALAVLLTLLSVALGILRAIS